MSAHTAAQHPSIQAMAKDATRTHYDRHLGPVYAWMSGDFDALARRSGALFDRIGLSPARHGRVAIDLGAGHGAQSVALAGRGFEVIAIDFCPVLLEALKRNAGDTAVTAIEGDLLDFRRYAHTPAGVVVCMGDTLTHLPSEADVGRVLEDTADALAPGGLFVATFRDYVTRTPVGEQRFIPVRADEQRILTCFLDYQDDAVTVYDLLHERTDDGWKFAASSYRKLRLDPHWLGACARAAGLEPVGADAEGGIITFVAQRR